MTVHLVGRCTPEADDVAWTPSACTACASCGSRLDGDEEDDQLGDGGKPICGECARSRHYIVLDVMDGELDAEIG